MTSGNPWKWTRRFAVGLSASVAGFSAFNFIAPFLPRAVGDGAGAIAVPDLLAAMLLAAIVGNAQGLANCMAANARRVGAAGHETAGRWCWFFCIGFAAMSWFGLHNAWEMVASNAQGYEFPDPLLMDLLFAFIAVSEPTMNWIVDLLKSLHKAEERQADRELRDEAAERETRRRDAEERRKGFHVASTTAAAAALAMAIPAAEFPIEPASHSALASADAAAHASHGWRGPRDQTKWDEVMRLHRDGWEPASIFREVGVKPSTGYRWLNIANEKRETAA